MNEILAIAHTPEHDDALVAALSRRKADRVTILIPETTGIDDDQRMAELVARAEWVTGGVAVGVAAHPDALDDRMFETVLHSSASSPVRRRWRLGSSSRRERASGLTLSPGAAR
jgi:hypothetical protein